MARRRYYYCPNCHDTMLGWVSDLDGREHWVCIGHPPCGLGRRPNPRARPPLGRPNVGGKWGVLVEAEEPASLRKRLRTRSRVAGTATPPPLSPMKPSPYWTVTSVFGAVITVLIVVAIAVVIVVAGQAYIDHSPRSEYSHTLCGDGWISLSQGPGTCSSHHGVEQYVYVEVTAPPTGWSSVK